MMTEFFRCKQLDPQGKQCIARAQHSGPHFFDHEDTVAPTTPPLSQSSLTRCSTLNPSGRKCVLRVTHTGEHVFNHEDNVMPHDPPLTSDWTCPKCHANWLTRLHLVCPICSLESGHTKSQPPLPQIFLDAAALISGPRKENYGDYVIEAQRIAEGWSTLTGRIIEPRLIPIMMIWLKLVREAHQPGQDNRNDCAGYLALLDQMLREKS